MWCIGGSAYPVSAAVTARFTSPNVTVQQNDTFSIDILADFSDPVVGFGLDLAFDDTFLSLVNPPTIGSDWIAISGVDGDDLAGLAFPNSVSGFDVVLATLTFTADLPGQTALRLSVTPGDLTEGFPLDPAGFDVVTFEPAQITIIPEAGTFLLLLAGMGMGWIGKVRRSAHRRFTVHLDRGQSTDAG